MGSPNVDLRSDGVLRAVITRADGTVEDVGVISASYASPLRQAWWSVVGRHLADRRIRRANQNALRIRKDR